MKKEAAEPGAEVTAASRPACHEVLPPVSPQGSNLASGCLCVPSVQDRAVASVQTEGEDGRTGARLPGPGSRRVGRRELPGDG